MAELNGLALAADATDAARLAMVYVGVPESPLAAIMTPPLGVQLLATVARRHGHTAEVFDSRVIPATAVAVAVPVAGGGLLDRLRAFRPDVVGFSFLSIAAGEAVALARLCRAEGWCTVAGGIHATVFGEELLAARPDQPRPDQTGPDDTDLDQTGGYQTGAYQTGDPVGTDHGLAFDVLVAGEGERAIVDICDAVAAGRRPTGLLRCAPVASLNDLPAPDFFPEYESVMAGSSGWRTAAVQSNRGCPMNCQFCEVARDAQLFEWPSERRRRSVATVLADIERLVDRYDTNWLVLVDSIATLNDGAIAELLREVRHRWPELTVQLNSHVNKVGREFLAALVPFGRMASVWIGFESGSQAILDSVHKETKAPKALVVAKAILATGATLGVNLLLGLPEETDDTRADTMAFAAALKQAERYRGQVRLNPNIFHPLPGSPLFHRIVAEGRRTQRGGPLGDFRVYSPDEIAAGAHPVRGVDYAAVIRQHGELKAMSRDDDDPSNPSDPSNSPDPDEPDDPGYRPWSEPRLT